MCRRERELGIGGGEDGLRGGSVGASGGRKGKDYN